MVNVVNSELIIESVIFVKLTIVHCVSKKSM